MMQSALVLAVDMVTAPEGVLKELIHPVKASPRTEGARSTRKATANNMSQTSVCKERGNETREGGIKNAEGCSL